MSGPTEHEYVLGTGDVEIRRLGIQHAAWREIAQAAWDRAGIARGHTVVDLGCGPGYATLDLAERVGPGGRVIAIDKSRRFLDHLRAQAKVRGLSNIECLERDLDADPLPARCADHVWSRWVFIFVRHPRELLARATAMLRPGGALVLHEYVDYASWRAGARDAGRACARVPAGRVDDRADGAGDHRPRRVALIQPSVPHAAASDIMCRNGSSASSPRRRTCSWQAPLP